MNKRIEKLRALRADLSRLISNVESVFNETDLPEIYAPMKCAVQGLETSLEYVECELSTEGGARALHDSQGGAE